VPIFDNSISSDQEELLVSDFGVCRMVAVREHAGLLQKEDNRSQPMGRCQGTSKDREHIKTTIVFIIIIRAY